MYTCTKSGAELCSAVISPRLYLMVRADLSERQMRAVYLSCNILPFAILVTLAMYRIQMRYQYNFCA